MIDFHTHILPKVDDGANCIDETIKMLKEAKMAGFNTIILTSHYIRNHFDVNVKDRLKLVEEIKPMLKENKIDIDLILGNEMYFSDSISEFIKSNEACSINNTKYVLFELPFNIKPNNLYDVIYSMLQNKFVPILAHPERYRFVWENPNLVKDLIEKGVLIQSNFGSFIGQYGKKAQILVKKFLKNDMVHFLGTDAHRKNTIYLRIPEILTKMEKYISKEKLEMLTKTNPKLVLGNKDIDILEPKEIKISIFDKMF